jgi:hypothetical protein
MHTPEVYRTNRVMQKHHHSQHTPRHITRHKLYHKKGNEKHEGGPLEYTPKTGNDLQDTEDFLAAVAHTDNLQDYREQIDTTGVDVNFAAKPSTRAVRRKPKRPRRPRKKRQLPKMTRKRRRSKNSRV